MTLASMTGFASQEVSHAGSTWVWELRSVNGRGLDIKTRLPEGADALDGQIRDRVAKVVRRGNVTVSLRWTVRAASQTLPDAEALEVLLEEIGTIQSAALRAGVSLAPVSVTDIMDGRLVSRGSGAVPLADDALRQALASGLTAALRSLAEMRAAEGAALMRVLTVLLRQVAELVAKAREIDKDRAVARKDQLQAAMRHVLASVTDVDAGRLEQELALLAVKADVSEELDRLDAHVEAARSYLKDDRPVGRKLDFLTQEFNREANTLCSKAQFPELTRVGLDLKAVIDQIREQVQNLE